MKHLLAHYQHKYTVYIVNEVLVSCSKKNNWKIITLSHDMMHDDIASVSTPPIWSILDGI